MAWFTFGLLLLQNVRLYILLLSLSALLYYFLFRKMYISVLDPLVFSLIWSSFGFSVVWFLYFTDSMETRYLYSYLITQGAFIAGLFTFKRLQTKRILSDYARITMHDEHKIVRTLFVVCSAMFILLQLLSYKVIGIPLLLGTHIDLYNSSGGWGIIGRFITVLKPASEFLLIYFLIQGKSSAFFKAYLYFFICCILIFIGLSGSRGEFMTLGLLLFCFLLLNAGKLKQYYLSVRKYERWMLGIGLLFVFSTILLQSKQGVNATGVFLFRLVASGDVYYFAYPNKNIEELGGNAFLALFGDIFSTLRLVPRERQPIVLGTQLYRMFSESDQLAGPNARHNVFGYVYYGFYGSIIFSYTLGLVISFVRNKLFFALRRNVMGQLLFVLLYMEVTSLETDPQMVVSNLENIMLIGPILLTVSALCYYLVTLDINSLPAGNGGRKLQKV